MGDKIRYQNGYEYQLRDTYVVPVGIYPPREIYTKYIRLTAGGTLTVYAGYAWDGASGPTINTKSSMRGALVHDALCQLMREHLLDLTWFKKVNSVFCDILLEDGMWSWRARLWKRGVDTDLAKASALKPRKIYEAP